MTGTGFIRGIFGAARAFFGRGKVEVSTVEQHNVPAVEPAAVPEVGRVRNTTQRGAFGRGVNKTIPAGYDFGHRDLVSEDYAAAARGDFLDRDTSYPEVVRAHARVFKPGVVVAKARG